MKHLLLFSALLGFIIFTACNTPGRRKGPTSRYPGKKSTKTNLAYNDPDLGFEVLDYKGQPDAPNMVFVEGGRTVIGTFQENVTYTHDNTKRTISIASFFMDETEVANIHWLEYMYYVRLDSSEETYLAARPDTTVWARRLAYNDPYVSHYLRYPGFRYYPVVGISWKQANDYCTWRTRVVNLGLADEAGLFDEAFDGEGLSLESGAVIPDIRLPTEAEWEYAAQGLIGTQKYNDENFEYGRIYPWDGYGLRYPYGRELGRFYANFKRGQRRLCRYCRQTQ